MHILLTGRVSTQLWAVVRKIVFEAAVSMSMGEAVIRPVAVNPLETISSMEMISREN